ncbi:MAG: hypothetical protein JHC54_17095, partial [Acinetobacter sp.]|nr:hypothetical protein [Acinetobacter sp.]
MEKDRDQKYNPIKSIDNIPGTSFSPKVYDMIGLIDNISVQNNYEQSDTTISVGGRDLSKVLIEDGCYFYPLQFAQNVFINPDEDTKLIRRLAIDGQFILQNQYTYRSIRYTLQYLMNHVASMGIVPDDVFAAYGNRRNLIYRIDGGYSSYADSAVAAADMVKQDINFICRGINPDQGDLLADLCISFIEAAYVNNSLNREGGSIVSYASFLWNGDLVQFQTTPTSILNLGAGFWRDVSIVTFDGQDSSETSPTSLLEKLFEYVDSKYRSKAVNNAIIETPANGIWQIIKLVVDESVADRRIVD